MNPAMRPRCRLGAERQDRVFELDPVSEQARRSHPRVGEKAARRWSAKLDDVIQFKNSDGALVQGGGLSLERLLRFTSIKR